MSHILHLLLFSILLSTGQIMFKFVANTTPTLGNFTNFISLAGNPWFYGAMFCYGSSTLLWIYLLQKLPLSYAYPFVAIGFVLIPIFSFFIFNEVLKFQYFVGVIFIILGILIISLTGK